MKKRVPVLTEEHFKLVKALQTGYPSTEEKFNHLWYGNQQGSFKAKAVITEYFDTKVNKLTRKSVTISKPKSKSERLFGGRTSILVKYPRSGKVYKARIRSKNGIAALEPTEPNTAFWLIDKSLLDSLEVIDLNKIPHIRQIHNKEGRELLSDFR